MTLVNLLAPVIQAMGYEMLGIEHIPNGGRSLLRIYIDNEAGIGLEDCSRVSKQVTGVLDVNDPIQGPYDLEVSSPGLDRPLFTLDQFRRFIGSRVRIHLREKIADRRNISGEIIAVDDESVEVRDASNNFQIPSELIDKARLLY